MPPLFSVNGGQEFVNQTIIGTGLGICVVFPEVVLWLPRQVCGP